MRVINEVDFSMKQEMTKTYEETNRKIAEKNAAQTERKPELDIKEIDKQPKLNKKEDLEKAYKEHKRVMLNKNMTPTERKAIQTYNAIQNGVNM